MEPKIGAGRRHFHHHGGGGGGKSTDTSSLLQDLSQVNQSSATASPASAQQAYATLQQELQQSALGSGAGMSALLEQPLVSLEA